MSVHVGDDQGDLIKKIDPLVLFTIGYVPAPSNEIPQNIVLPSVVCEKLGKEVSGSNNTVTNLSARCFDFKLKKVNQTISAC